MTEPAFSLRGVRYRYNRRQPALDGVDLDIELGERVALLGANGSGKSTLLKMLDGIIAPTEGSMRALGRDVAAVAAGEDAFRFHRSVGLVCQEPDIQLCSATVLDDVMTRALGLAPLHRSTVLRLAVLHANAIHTSPAASARQSLAPLPPFVLYTALASHC